MTSGLGFGHLWQQHDLSDVDVVLSYEAPAALHLQRNQVLYRSITSVPGYNSKSFEELRLEHWNTSNCRTAGASALVQQGAGSLPCLSRPADSKSVGMFMQASGRQVAQGLACTAYTQPAQIPLTMCWHCAERFPKLRLPAGCQVLYAKPYSTTYICTAAMHRSRTSSHHHTA
jgi:hypothetical protein